MNANLTPRLLVMLTLPPLLWAGNAVAGRLLVGAIGPFALNAVRWGTVFFVLLPLAWRVFQRPHEILARWKYLLGLSLLGVGTYNALQYVALQTSTPVNVTLILSSLPVWMLAVGALFYRVHPTSHQAIGAVLSLAGVAFVISRGDPHVLLQLRVLPGDAVMLLAVILWSGYGWALAQPPASMRGEARPDWDWAGMLILQVAFGMLFAGPAAGIEALVRPTSIAWTPGTLAGIAYIVVGPSVIAYWCWGVAVATAGPTIASFFNNLTPLFAAVMSAALLGEAPRWYHVAAFAFIVAGIVVTSRGRSGGPHP